MTIKTQKNYYSILGVTPDSETNEIKGAYRKLARKYHPDVNNNPDSIIKFKDILEAYETLSNNIKRKEYDMVNGFYRTPEGFKKKKQQEMNKSDNSSEEKKTCKNTDESNKREFQTRERPSFKNKTSNLKNDSDIYHQKFFRETINSILDEISRTHKTKNIKKTPKAGSDIYTEISISLEESVKGTERLLNIMHKELCPQCQGRKFINNAKCTICNGSGEYELKRKIKVKIPAGIKNNAKLRLLNEGNPGFWGGSNGNLYITVKIEQDTNYKIEGNNILYKLPVTPFEAVLGANISIPSFNGNILLTIPPHTNSGQKFRLANQGIKTNGKFGDMIVIVEIQLQKNLSADEIKMYEKLRKMSNENIRENN